VKKKGDTPQQRWARKNRDKLAAACRRWRKRHPDRQKAGTYRWRASNKGKWDAYVRSWCRRNPALVRAATRRRWRKIKKDPARYAKHLAARRKWAALHPESIRRKSARYRKNNLNKVRRYARRWMQRWYYANLRKARKRLKMYRLRNPEKWRAYDRDIYRRKLRTNAAWMKAKLAKGRAWAKRNPEKQRHRVGRYRVRRLGAKGSHTFAEWLAVIRRHRWKCFYCQRRITRSTVTKDHLIPLSKEGTDFAANLVPACKSCNSGKSGRLVYRNWKGE
jgi:5-methylcytosine-specific restriction endonuclease McrA